jgi:hypothetical protein
MRFDQLIVALVGDDEDVFGRDISQEALIGHL